MWKVVNSENAFSHTQWLCNHPTLSIAMEKIICCSNNHGVQLLDRSHLVKRSRFWSLGPTFYHFPAFFFFFFYLPCTHYEQVRVKCDSTAHASKWDPLQSNQSYDHENERWLGWSSIQNCDKMLSGYRAVAQQVIGSNHLPEEMHMYGVQ